jgi:hypothetical protein
LFDFRIFALCLLQHPELLAEIEKKLRAAMLSAPADKAKAKLAAAEAEAEAHASTEVAGDDALKL